MLNSNKKDKEKEMLAWFRGLTNLKRAEVMQPYFPKYDIKDMPLIVFFKHMDFNKKLEIYKKEGR
jgi:hypothetical protein